MTSFNFIRNTTEPVILDGDTLMAYAVDAGYPTKSINADSVGVGFTDAHGEMSIWYGTSWQELVHDFSDILKAVRKRADEADA